MTHTVFTFHDLSSQNCEILYIIWFPVEANDDNYDVFCIKPQNTNINIYSLWNYYKWNCKMH